MKKLFCDSAIIINDRFSCELQPFLPVCTECLYCEDQNQPDNIHYKVFDAFCLSRTLCISHIC